LTDTPKEPPLDSEPEPRNRRWIWYWLVATSLIAYPLSVGPVHWIYRKSFVAPPPYALQLFYKPLEWLYETIPLVKTLYDKYFEFLGVP
jgi:hypothetical protein